MTILDHCGNTLMRRQVVGLGTGLSTENVDGESTSYPAGRSYRLQLDGSIVITFSVVPERKGRSICSILSLLRTEKALQGGTARPIRKYPSTTTAIAFDRRHLTQTDSIQQ